MTDKVMTMRRAVESFVDDGATVCIEGFTHLIPHAVGHEIIRQHRRGLTLVRLTPDLIADQMIAAGCVDKLIFSWMGNPGVGSLHVARRAVEEGRLELEEWTHFALTTRYQAGASGLSFLPIRSFRGSDLPGVNPAIRTVTDPYTGEETYVVPAIRPDVTIIHVQRADARGNAQVWGLLGCQREAAQSATKVVVVCEELVDTSVIRADPNRTLVSELVVDAVVVEPWGCHPSFAQGYQDRDNRFYLDWDGLSRDPERMQGWLDEHVWGTENHSQYLDRIGRERLAGLEPGERWSGEVNYGRYA